MPKTVSVDEVRTLLGQGAQLVEVLPLQEYEDLHLPGAINLPLKELNEDSVKRLDRDRAVITYCWNHQ